MKQLLVRFLRDERGEDLIEYGLLAAFVASVAVAVIIGPAGEPLRDAVKAAYQKATDALTTP